MISNSSHLNSLRVINMIKNILKTEKKVTTFLNILHNSQSPKSPPREQNNSVGTTQGFYNASFRDDPEKQWKYFQESDLGVNMTNYEAKSIVKEVSHTSNVHLLTSIHKCPRCAAFPSLIFQMGISTAAVFPSHPTLWHLELYERRMLSLYIFLCLKSLVCIWWSPLEKESWISEPTIMSLLEH